MRSHNLYILIIFAAALGILGCGDESNDPGLFLSGTYSLLDDGQSMDSPVLVVLTNSIDADLLENNPRDVVIEYMVADKSNNSFRMDLSSKNISPEDDVFLIAFADNNYTGAVPFPDTGDLIGVYAETGRISPAIRLKPGENDGFHIDINREVFDYEASISGTILGNDAGDVTLVAYAGDINSSDFTGLDFDEVIGFTTANKKDSSLDYTLNILPYGKNVPIENVQVFVLLDANESETVDAGDRIGFYGNGDDFSTLLTIEDGAALTDIDIEFSFDVKEPCGVEMTISGSFILPDEYTQDSPPVYIAIFDGNDPDGVLDDPFESVLYFSKVPGGESEFSYDLSETGICPGDKVMVVGLWDRDFVGGLPNFTPGDFIGIYVEEGKISPSVSLNAGENNGFHIDITREVFDYEASISGTILGNDTGEVTLVAYAGDLDSSDFTGLNFNEVIGFTTVNKNDSPLNYTLDILPYGKNVPIDNVQVFALLDANNSDAVDAGDRIGFYGKGDDFSTLLTIADKTALTEIFIEFKFDVQEPCGLDISLSGDFTVPNEYTKDSPPVYIAVFDGSDPAGVLDDPFGSILYFSKVPVGETAFSYDLSDTGICPDDEIMVIGLWDRDFVGGFPNFTIGDFIGIYIEEGKISPTVQLDAGANSGFHIDISREVFDYEASISGTILGDDAGEVTLVAYAGEITSSDFSSLDFNEVVGFATVNKKKFPLSYTLDILPYGKNVPIENVQVFALLDANNNGTVDGGDRIGFYGKGSEYSSLLTITDGAALIDIDIDFKFDVSKASGYEISIAGTFSVPSGYLSGTTPIYITVFDSDNPTDIIDDPFSTLKYFYKMPATDFYFDCDLSHTDLVPGDEVIVAALWDRDYEQGFPDITKGDKIGLVVNKETYQFTAALNYGKNVIPPEAFEFKVNKRVYDYTASIDYALDLSDTGSFDMEKAQLIVLSLHVEGIAIGVSFAGTIEFDIDMDYLLGVDILPATEYDYIGIGEKDDPYCSRQLPILSALYDRVVVFENNSPPDPLIKGVDQGEITERTAYLVAILDKNGNGQLDGDDQIGYYGNSIIEIINGQPLVDLPCWCDFTIPECFSGIIRIPTPVKRITNGQNQEEREDGSSGPYWISNFINSSLIQ